MDYKDKIINAHQVGGIETFTYENGAARGSRAAWINTGSGLRFKVAIDRGMDIVDAFYNQYSLAWLSHNGITSPRPDSDRGANWLNNFPGGLVTTCGLSHFGGPEDDRGVHGKYSNMPAEIESVIQPDLNDSSPEMSITGKVKESKLFGPNLELKRQIKCKLFEPTITITDRVINRGNKAVPLMLLYHCNFGWPLADEGTKIIYKGECKSRGLDRDEIIFGEGKDCKTCKAPYVLESGISEAVAFITPEAENDGYCYAGLFNEKLNFGATLKFKNEQLPCLTNWQYWGIGEYVTGIEPGTNFPTGQNKARETNTLTMLEPGESKDFSLEISIIKEI